MFQECHIIKKNGKLKATIYGNDYSYNEKTGVAKKYNDPFNYGEKTKETLESGNDISIGNEKFRVFSTENNKIKAIAHYNLMLNLNPIIQATQNTVASAGTSTFSSYEYWKVGEAEIDMYNSDNHIQPYITKYGEYLENLGAESIDVRIARFSEYSSIFSDLINGGWFWLGSARSYYGTHYGIWNVYTGGYSSSYQSDERFGVRTIIVFDKD